jgi:hypothetical protein
MQYPNHIILVLLIGVLVLFHKRVLSDKALLDHIDFSYECFDRVITNCLARELQYEKGLAVYLFDHYGDVSREVVKARTSRIHEQMENLADKNGIKIKKVDIGTNLLELAQKEYRDIQQTSDDKDRIVAIFKQADYGSCWNFHAKEKILRRKIRRVYHYTVYHFDRDFGLGSHTLNTYLPNSVRGYFNQHNWIVQQLKHRNLFNEDIKMYYNSFQDIGSLDPKRFQAICDTLTYDDVSRYDEKWIQALWPELSGLIYRSYLNEVEFCSNIAFKQKSFLNHFYNNHILFTYDLSRPENLSFVFKRRIDRRYKSPFKTKLRIVETKPSIKFYYKRQQYKEYLKSRILRSESTVNNAMDLGLRKRDLEGIRKASREINERVISLHQPVDPDWIRQDLDHNPFGRVMVGDKWIPGIKINDEKMASIMRGLCQCSVKGIKMRDLTDFTNQDMDNSTEDGYKLSQISYAVRIVRGHGLVEKVDNMNLYRLTPAGQGFVRMFLQVTEKVVFPFTKNIMRFSKEPRRFRKGYQKADSKADNLSKLNGVYKNLDKGISELFDIIDIVDSEEVAT